MIRKANSKRFQEILRVASGYRHLILSESFPVLFEYQGNKYRFWLSGGFAYDQASIPRILWPVIAPRELGYLPPAAHDYLIERHGRVSIEKWSSYFGKWTDVEAPPFTREQADKLFCALMRSEGIPRWKRRLAYRAVRSYGAIKKFLTGKEW